MLLSEVIMEAQRSPETLWQKGDYQIRKESVSEAAKDANALLKQHWLEIANYKDRVPLEPSWDDVYDLERRGAVILLTLREKGELIGYSMFITRWHLHYKQIVADNDILFVRADKRKGRLGLQLIKESEKELRKLKVDKITWHMKPAKSFASLLEKLGYMHEELIYGKLLR